MQRLETLKSYREVTSPFMGGENSYFVGNHKLIKEENV